jgi:prevent-host-death family protein
MQTMSAREAKYAFGKLIDLARLAPVTVAKHGRAVVVVMAVEEFQRLKAQDNAGARVEQDNTTETPKQ